RAARATAPEARGAARAARLHCAGASHPGPRGHGRCSERGVAQSSAARSSSPRRHPRSCDPALTTRSPESAAPPSDPGLTGTPLPDPLRSDDQQLAPWPASATHGAPAYPLRDRTGIQAESFARNPYEGTPMKVIALLAWKGGVGKSTLTINLATAAIEDGHNVGIIDLDPQSSLSEGSDRREAEQPFVSDAKPRAVAQIVEAGRGIGLDLMLIDTP